MECPYGETRVRFLGEREGGVCEVVRLEVPVPFGTAAEVRLPEGSGAKAEYHCVRKEGDGISSSAAVVAIGHGKW